MVAEWLQRLLILQDRDERRDTIRRQISAIPDEIRKEEAAIARVEADLAERTKALKAREAERLDLEGEVALAEETVVKYKTQQLQVKKNEEYTALETEIANLRRRIDDLENRELELMEAIELEEAELETARREGEQEMATLRAHIERLHRNQESYKGELGEAEEAVRACEAEIDPPVLQQYRYVKSQVKRPPVVAELRDGRCSGCHLKVSGDVESTARKGTDLVRCDSCGRILYYDR
jgi:predicted  nucleic acid-binding Zn-ribbon protein